MREHYRPPTRERLRARALRYLERHPASRARLERVLTRRAAHEAAVLGVESEIVAADVKAVLDELVGRGLVDDAVYARGRTRALLRRGRSLRRVRHVLAEDGIEAPVVEELLAHAEADVGDLDRAAAVRYARRRGLGPFRDPTSRSARRMADLRALVRQGFAYPLARQVIDARGPDALEDPLA